MDINADTGYVSRHVGPLQSSAVSYPTQIRTVSPNGAILRESVTQSTG
jgi:hypothetical protein